MRVVICRPVAVFAFLGLLCCVVVPGAHLLVLPSRAVLSSCRFIRRVRCRSWPCLFAGPSLVALYCQLRCFRSPSPMLSLSPSRQLYSGATHGCGRLRMCRLLCGVRRCSTYMFRFSGSFIILIGLKSSIPPISSICTLFRCPSFSWWCRDPDPCARWVCVVLSFGLVGGHPPCGPHGFWFTPFVHFCTRDPERHWSALHTCQPSDPIFKSYRIRFSVRR